MNFDPKKVAVEYYFGDLPYWKLPNIIANALEHGFDGPALRRLAGLATLERRDIRAEDVTDCDIDSAFCEMGVDAPITTETAQRILATESAQRAISCESNIFEEATYIRIHVCRLSDPPEFLRDIVNLSREAKSAPRSRWDRIEASLKEAFTDFLKNQKKLSPL